jgi:hypothetical protein
MALNELRVALQEVREIGVGEYQSLADRRQGSAHPGEGVVVF